MKNISTIILTYNESRHIARAIRSVQDFCEDIFIIDSGSTDGTQDIARSLGATVLFNRWRSHADQFQWGLDNAPIRTDWVLRLDADEIIEDDLALAFQGCLKQLPASVTGVNLKRKHVFMGRWVRHGGRYPIVMLRLFRTGCARVEQRLMDEHIVLTQGTATTIDGGFADINLNDLSYFTEKHNKYATLEAIEVIKSGFGDSETQSSTALASRSARTKRYIKEKIYNKLPLGMGPFLYFSYRYFIQMGFLDGPTGTIYHFLQAFWYRFLVDAKVFELRSEIGGLNPAQARDKLEHITKLKLS